MKLYAKLTLLCVTLVVLTCVLLYFFINMELGNAFDAGASSQTDVEEMVDAFQGRLLYVILSILLAAIIVALVMARIFVKPIIQLSKDAKKVGHQGFSTEISNDRNDEIGKLARAISDASDRLTSQLKEQKKLNEELEAQHVESAKRKQELEEVNMQIHDSIIYAQRIQRSILPDLENMSRLIKDAFVLYKPKDVVSGDFYWFERVRQGRNEYLIIACADCTGHGVPGAIMSIMGSNQLTNIVYYQNTLDPVKILARLDKVIKFELQRDREDQNRDGMEIGICVINLDDLQMEFSGVGIPLYLIKKGTSELITLKSPKLMIGGIDGDEKQVTEQLTKQVIQLEDGDRLYLSSDGYQDQFGGENDKKFMSKNLRLLMENHVNTPMKEQETIFENTFDKWVNGKQQTDDVLVIGVEI